MAVEWFARAACLGADTEMFFSCLPADDEAAKAICAGCEVREDCLAHAMHRDTREELGIWGGLTSTERRRERRNRWARARRKRQQEEMA